MSSAAAALRALERARDDYGAGSGGRKRALLAVLANGRLRSAGEVRRLHEALCFLRAYPDDAPVLEVVEQMVAASTDAPTCARIARRWPTAASPARPPGIRSSGRRRAAGRPWPERLRLDRNDAEAEKSLGRAAPLLVTPRARSKAGSSTGKAWHI